MNTERWKRAQIAEKKYWLSTSKSWSTEDATWYWQRMLAHGFTLGYEFFAGKSVLEVGCGPAGIIFQLHNTKSRAGLEPMDLKDLIIDGKRISIVKKGIGEEIPFENESFDVVLSFNALDHSVNPLKVIQEIQRVLRKNGDFLLWIYVLRNHYKLLQGLLNKVDSPHPYHFTLSQISRLLGEGSFEIKYTKNEKGTGLPNNTIKKAVANQMMDTLWLWAKKDTSLG
jgi:ubiquinone/menaquinone biosynthesis C-methylase UbiE